MAKEVKSNAWGTLITVKRSEAGNFEEGKPIRLARNEITIGRLEGCDIAHDTNKFLSAEHCKLIYDENNGKRYLCDTSKNGTLVNTKKVKNEMVELSDGAVIRCVFKKNQPEQDVMYLFKSEDLLKNREDDATLQINATQEYSNESEDNMEEVNESIRKRRATSDDDDAHSCKVGRFDSTCHPKPIGKDKSVAEDNKEVEENLTCGICQDIFHNCISAQPCMHSFCASCFSKWMIKSDICPTCRKVVKQVGKNHTLNNLVVAFLKIHPDRQRSKEEITEMDETDRIKNKTVKVGSGSGSCDDDHLGGSSQESYDDYDDDDEDEHVGSLQRIPSVFSRSAATRCRQCPAFSSQNGSSSSTGSSPQNGFTCSLNQVHILCSCCEQLFPDRRNTILSTSSSSTGASANVSMDIQCTSCGRLYCNLYWGCRKPGCLGCLNQFKDFNFGDSCLSRILNNNEFESNIFKQYLTQKSIDIRELLRLCLEKFQSKQFALPSRPNLTEHDVLCFKCGLRYFKDLAYQFRANIPRDELPNEVMAREDCYWGKNCRTQQHNSNHARGVKIESSIVWPGLQECSKTIQPYM